MWSRLWKNTRWTRPSSSVEPSWTVTTWRNTYSREEEVYTQANTHPHQYKHNSLETLMYQLHISFFSFFLFWWWWEEGGGVCSIWQKVLSLFKTWNGYLQTYVPMWNTVAIYADAFILQKKKLQRSLKSKAEWQWQNARLNLNNLPLIFYFSNFFYLYKTQYKEMGRFVATWQTAWWEPVEGSYDMRYFHGQP